MGRDNNQEAVVLDNKGEQTKDTQRGACLFGNHFWVAEFVTKSNSCHMLSQRIATELRNTILRQGMVS